MRNTILIAIMLSISIIHKDLSFYGFLQVNEFDKELVVGIEKNEFLYNIESYSFNDGIESYTKTYFKSTCKEIIEINWRGKKYPICFLLSEEEKNKLKSCKKHLYLTFQKTRKFGKLTIFLTGISKYSE